MSVELLAVPGFTGMPGRILGLIGRDPATWDGDIRDPGLREAVRDHFNNLDESTYHSITRHLSLCLLAESEDYGLDDVLALAGWLQGLQADPLDSPGPFSWRRVVERRPGETPGEFLERVEGPGR